MQRYFNLGGNSGIKAYELLPDGIRIQFTDGSIYLYNHKSNGRRAIETMKSLAQKGIGLTTYINQKVRGKFAEKLE